ncbi:DUF3592 domain-containing protein [Nonomuraea sp. NBC_00507]|uniref:DUF3592 domain-containing protein n=1 Tax=Nonomuraea sp. NBC_00507 TaxID=2976002 RepID=UPI002E19E155
MGSLLLALLAFAISGTAFWQVRRMSASHRRTRDWPTITGRIIHKSITGEGRRFRALVAYSYTVDGVEHTNDKIGRIGLSYGPQNSIQAFVDRLPDQPHVHYNPADPMESYLFDPPKWLAWVVPTMALFALFVGFVWLSDAIGSA